MKILAIGDLHGKMPAIKKIDFDCIVLVGDICDDSKLGKYYRKWFKLLKDNKEDTPTAQELMIKDVGLSGVKKMHTQSIKKGNEILKYLDSFGKPIFMVAGNWDQSYGETRIQENNKSNYGAYKSFYDYYLGDEINPKLIKGLKNIKNCMFHCHEFQGINFFGYGLSSAAEKLDMVIKKNKEIVRGRKLNKMEIARLRKAYNKIPNKLKSRYVTRKNKKLPTIFISHNIPNNTKLDLIKDKKSYAYGKHLGSTIAREFCLKFKPTVCIGGHIHEGKGKDKIEKTIIINPGMDKVLVEVNEKIGKVKSIKFIE